MSPAGFLRTPDDLASQQVTSRESKAVKRRRELTLSIFCRMADVLAPARALQDTIFVTKSERRLEVERSSTDVAANLSFSRRILKVRSVWSH